MKRLPFVLLSIAVLGACENHPTKITPARCIVVAVGPVPSTVELSPSLLSVALQDAATRLGPGLGSSDSSTRLSASLQGVDRAVRESDLSRMCHLFNETVAALSAWDAAHTRNSPFRPDFSLIQHTLGVLEGALRAHLRSGVNQSLLPPIDEVS